MRAAEWTHHISYSSSLIAFNVRGHDATAENIQSSKEFGISIAGEDQNVVCSVAGRYCGRQMDKIHLLKEAGIANFYESKSINLPMIQDAAMNAECRLMKQEELGDHIKFVGEVVEISENENIKPLVYHNGKYWRLGENVLSPQSEIEETIEKLSEKYRRIK
jgi:flavin reductase (DIM6/NTAB) family NADH-FMN oxidoreductase RutF